MATASSDLKDNELFPSYDEARKLNPRIHITHGVSRMYLSLNEPLSSSVYFMNDIYLDPDTPMVPYFEANAITQSSPTEPKISSVPVRIDQLEDWENEWVRIHLGHAEPGVDDAQFGTLPDYDPDSDSEDEGPEYLLRCCEGDRPTRKKRTLLVKATKDFVTTDDYVSAVHPWLMSLREEILQASGDLMDQIPLLSDTKLVVLQEPPSLLRLCEEEFWRCMRTKPGTTKPVHETKILVN